MKEREGKEGRRLKWILFNDFKIMLIECNGRNVLSQAMEIIDLISLSLHVLLHLLLCLLIFFIFSLLCLSSLCCYYSSISSFFLSLSLLH